MAGPNIYGNSYSDLNPVRQTSGQSILALLGLMQRGQLANQEQDYRNRALIQQQNLSQAAQDLEWERLNRMDQTGPAYQVQDQFRQAQDDASQGLFGSPAEVRAKYPLLPRGSENSFAQQSLAVRPEYERRARLAGSTRDLLNQYAEGEGNVREEQQNQAGRTTELANIPRGFFWNTDKLQAASDQAGVAKKALQASKDRQVQYQAGLAGLQPKPTDKELMSLVVQDPTSRRWESLVQTPPWLQPGRTAAGAAPTARDTIASTGREIINPPVMGRARLADDPNYFKAWTRQRAAVLSASGLPTSKAVAQAISEYSAQFPGGMARGGEIHGPGTSTSDSIPIRASAGEYIVPAEAMQIPGVPQELDHIRRMALHQRRMNMGGRVMSYQDGGEVGFPEFTNQPGQSGFGTGYEDQGWNAAPAGMGSQSALGGTGQSFWQRLLMSAMRQPQSQTDLNAYDVLASRKGDASFYPDQPMFGAPKQSGGRPNGYSVLSAYMGNSGGGGGGY